ncbi:hypothetical protein GJ744_001945 [Endocarpon pusillum]|uniref:Uncharacterized protein n=1 Tax=Endocarpon pusillum TaxID=364733 RepID=A0A8H7ASX9_9EURO|nr:hypothetical protein GJ744_001945 [Endocarpon pusillum]
MRRYLFFIIDRELVRISEESRFIHDFVNPYGELLQHHLIVESFIGSTLDEHSSERRMSIHYSLPRQPKPFQVNLGSLTCSNNLTYDMELVSVRGLCLADQHSSLHRRTRVGVLNLAEPS